MDVIAVIFFLISASVTPWLISKVEFISFFAASFVLFNCLRRCAFLLPDVKAEKSGMDPSYVRSEILNRVTSIAFNLSVGILVNLSFYKILLPPQWWIDNPIAFEYHGPILGAWAMGYVLYDFLHLNPKNTPMRIHHLGEMFIVWTMGYSPQLGNYYAIGGACMQISSAFLHLNKIMSLLSQIKTEKEHPWLPAVSQWVRYLLILTWIHGRLIMGPQWIYHAYLMNPLTGLHVGLLAVFLALTAANVVWLYKIITKVSVT